MHHNGYYDEDEIDIDRLREDILNGRHDSSRPYADLYDSDRPYRL